MKILLLINILIASLVLSGCAKTTSIQKSEKTIFESSKKYSIDDIKISLSDMKIYDKTNNKIITGLIIVDENKTKVKDGRVYKVDNGLLKNIYVNDLKKSENLTLEYDNAELRHCFMKTKKISMEIKFKNQNLTYLELTSKKHNAKLELDENNQVKYFNLVDLNKNVLISIKNSKVKYFRLPNKQLIKSTDYFDDQYAQKLINDYINILKREPLSFFTYKKQLGLLYSDSKSSTSIEECRNLLGAKTYDRLLALYQNQEAVLMQCRYKAFESR